METGRLRKTSLPARMLYEQRSADKLPMAPRSSDSRIRQSAYRPLSRPQPRYSQITPPTWLGISSASVTLWGPATQRVLKKQTQSADVDNTKPVKPDIVVIDASPILEEIQTKDNDEQDETTVVGSSSTQKGPDLEKAEGVSAANGSPHLLSSTGYSQKSKSVVRRRPRKQRRKTGLGVELEADEEEDVPDELEGLVTRKSPDMENSPSSPDSLTENTPDLQDPDPVFYSDEVTQLRRLLQRETSRHHRLLGEMNKAQSDLEEYKTKVLELTKRYETVTKAYDKERKDKEQCNKRLDELEQEVKSIAGEKGENQRLRDENSALIRVITQLSRPTPV